MYIRDLINEFDNRLTEATRRAKYSWSKEEIKLIRKAFPNIRDRYFIVDGSKGRYCAWDPDGKVNDFCKRGVGILDLARAFVNKNKKENFKTVLLIKSDIRPNQSKKDMYHIFLVSKL